MSTDRDKFKTNIKPHLCDLRAVIEPSDLALELYSKNCITAANQESISCKETNHGKLAAASHLLIDVLSRSEGWYNILLSWLLRRSHHRLVEKIDSDFYRQYQSRTNHVTGASGCVDHRYDSPLPSSASYQSEQSTVYKVVEADSAHDSLHENNTQNNGHRHNKRYEGSALTEHDNTKLQANSICSVSPIVRSAAQVTSPETYAKVKYEHSPGMRELPNTTADERDTDVLKPISDGQSEQVITCSYTAYSSGTPQNLYVPVTRMASAEETTTSVTEFQRGDPAATEEQEIPAFSQLLPSSSSASIA